MSIEGLNPHIRSFHARRGRMSAQARSEVARLWPRLGIDVNGLPLDLECRFGSGVPVVLEIGFGLGEATASMAAADPGTGILAIDVHTPGVARLLTRIEATGLTNVRVAHGDAMELVRDQIARGSLAGVRAFFPDPWPKARHHKRRLVRPDFVALLGSRLRPGGFLHVATDWCDYARQMGEVLDAEPLLANAYAGPAPRPEKRPVTKFERAGLDLGHQVTDLVYLRRQPA